MNERIDIEQLFQDNQHKFKLDPSDKSWLILQKKLRKRRKVQSANVVRIWSIAAGILILVVFLFLLQPMLAPNKIQFETLNAEIDEKENILAQVHMFRHHDWNPAHSEGERNNKLVPALKEDM